MPNTTRGFITFQDFGREKSSMTFNLPKAEEFGGGIDIYNNLIAITNILAAVDPVTMGVVSSQGITHDIPTFTNPPADPDAQREKKWLVTYRDITPTFTINGEAYPNPSYGKLFNIEIPTAELNTTLLDRRNDEWTYNEFTQLPTVWHDFKTTLELWAKSPNGGSIQIERVKFVGRNT